MQRPTQYPGMLESGKPFIATMYYERYYEYPAEYDLMDRDLEDIAARGWTVAFTDYINLSLGPVWDHYYETAERLGLTVMPDQWNAFFHAGGPFRERVTLPTTETGGPPAGWGIGAQLRYTDPTFVSAMVDYQSQVLSRYIDHPMYPRVLGKDGKFHPVMIVIYETGMSDYDGKWLEYSPDTKEKWNEFQQKRIGKILESDPPKPSELDKQEALVLWNEFRAKYISDGWGAVSCGLKERYPGLYTIVIFRQHGLLEGSKSGVHAGGIGNRAIRPELWPDFDIVADEHDGDDGVEYILATADLIKSAAVGRMGAVEYYLDSGYKAWSARQVEFHRPWGQSEMLGSLSARGLLAMHYGYNERDDRAGIAATGRREKDAQLWQKAACEEAAEANKVFAEVAPFVCAAKSIPSKAAIVMPYEAYALVAADELPLDKLLVGIWVEFYKRDIAVDWVFSSKPDISESYSLLVVPDAPYSKEFADVIAHAEQNGISIVRVPTDSSDVGLEIVSKALSLHDALRIYRLPAKPGVETAQLIGEDYTIDVIINHSDSPVSYAMDGEGQAFPASALSNETLTVPGHRTVWWIVENQ